MSKWWVIADTHYNHSNICDGVTKWTNGKTRNFATLEEMNAKIVESINKYVGVNDVLYHLGDWSFGGIESLWEFRKQIICKNVIIIPGNHDHHIKNNKVLPNCGYVLDKNYNKKILTLGSNALLPNGLKGVRAEMLFTKVLPELSTVTYSKDGVKYPFVLSHYPIESWENMERGSIMLHGHVHHGLDYTDLNLYSKRKDVGMDWEEFRPFSFDEIIEEMSTRKNKERY